MEDLSLSFAYALGLDMDRVIGGTIADIFGPAATNLFREGFQAAADGRSPSLRIPLVQGSLVRSRIFLFRAPGLSEPRCLVALERRNRTAPIEDDHGLTSLNSLMFFTHDLKTRHTHYMNTALAQTLGLPETGPQAHWLLRQLHRDDHAAFRACLRALPNLAIGEVVPLAARFRDTQHKWRSLLIRASVMDNSLTGVVEDFTDHAALYGALKSAARAVLDIEARERRRIARELHDSTAQHLVAIGLGLSSLLLRGAIKADHAALAQIRHALAEAQKEIRSFSYLLHPPQVAEDGLKPALAAFLEGFGQRTGLIIETNFTGPLMDLSPQTERALFRVTQEALMNIHRHAGATQARVALIMNDHSVSLDISDNGAGMPEHALLGAGLHGMKARMAEIGGAIAFANSATGFHLHATCPIGTTDMKRRSA